MMKKMMIAGSLLIFAGLTVFAAVMTLNGWDFTKLGTTKYETNIYESNEEFRNISIKTDIADIVFIPSDSEETKVVCYEADKVKHSVSVSDSILAINEIDTRKWYEYAGINFKTPKITVYLPKGEYSSLIIEEKTGDIEIPDNFNFESIDISVSTGDVKCYASAAKSMEISATTGNINVSDTSVGLLNLYVSTGNVSVSEIICDGDVTVGVTTGKTNLTDIVCQSVISSGNTGDILLKNAIAAKSFSIKRSTGDVTFENADASEVFVETDTGDVRGSLLTNKVFTVRTDTGKVNVPSSSEGGICNIITDTGDIKITVK